MQNRRPKSALLAEAATELQDRGGGGVAIVQGSNMGIYQQKTLIFSP